MDLGGGGGGGLGNLADELAGAFDEDYEEGEYGDGDYGDEDHDLDREDTLGGAPDISPGGDGDGRANGEEGGQGKDDGGVRDSGVHVESSSPGRSSNKRGSLGVPPQNNGRGHRRAMSEYDGSEYGSESDLESPGMPPKLVDKMDEVESLVRRGVEKNGSAADGTFARVTEGLRDLGSQAGVEGGATR